jgi:hypothetical protein
MLTTMQTATTPIITHPYSIRFVPPAAEAQGILNAIRYALHGYWSARDQLLLAKQQAAYQLIQRSTSDGYGPGVASDVTETATQVRDNIQSVEAWEAILCDLTHSFTSYTRCIDDAGKCLIETEARSLMSELEDRYKLPKCVRECFDITSSTPHDHAVAD